MSGNLAEKLIYCRRELHSHPELSNQEFATSEKITGWLQDAGIRILPLKLETGVVAEIGSIASPVIALRADIDALPIQEISGVPFTSRHDGVMHACGHDIHTSVMLGAALLLKQQEASLPGTVRIFFQPAEENFSGANLLIKAGALDHVAAVFGMHNAPELPYGTFATRGGSFYAHIDRFQITVTGKGAHAAQPEQGIDTIVTASQIVNALQTLPSRNFSSLESLVVSVTRIQGGNTWNVLPQTVELEGTVRTHNSKIRARVPEILTRVINGVASAMGAEASLNWHPGPPAVVNTPFWAQFSQQVAAEAGYVVQEAERQMGGEDFSLYLQQVPGVFVSIGSASEYGLHHPRFNPNEQLIYPAAGYFARLAQQALTHLQTQHAPQQTEPVE